MDRESNNIIDTSEDMEELRSSRKPKVLVPILGGILITTLLFVILSLVLAIGGTIQTVSNPQPGTNNVLERIEDIHIELTTLNKALKQIPNDPVIYNRNPNTLVWVITVKGSWSNTPIKVNNQHYIVIVDVVTQEQIMSTSITS